MEECQEISGRIEIKFGFPNCAGFMDGALIPLAFKPGLNGADYFSCKCGYVLNVLITCDDLSRVCDIVLGWPGSVHDNHIWSNSTLFLNKDCFAK